MITDVRGEQIWECDKLHNMSTATFFMERSHVTTFVIIFQLVNCNSILKCCKILINLIAAVIDHTIVDFYS